MMRAYSKIASMTQFVLGLFLVLSSLSFLGADAQANSEANSTPSMGKATATIPMDEFLELRRKNDRVDLTVVEETKWTGIFGKSLSVSFSGSTTGRVESVEILERNGNIVLVGCLGQAILHGTKERLLILPTAQKFKLTCQARVRSWNQLEIPVLNSVSVDAQITGAESILEVIDGGHRLTVARAAVVDPSLEKAEVAAVARYRISVLPEESRFDYQFVLSNPGRNRRSFSIAFPNGEIVQAVKSDAEAQESSQDLKISLVPGENRITVSGRFNGSTFKAPVERAQNFLLLENQPTLQLNVESEARRISASDAGLSSQFPASRAYLLGSASGAAGTLKWSTRKLESFSSLGYSVTGANYQLYVPRQGTPIVEASLTIENQGMPEIALKIPGRATFVEVSGQPQVLAKDSEGRLLLQLPTGQQQVLVQYETEATAGGFGSRLFENLLRPDAILSNVNVSLTLDERWRMVIGRGLYDADSDVSFSKILFATLISLLAFAFLRLVGFSGRAPALIVAATFGCSVFDQGLGYLIGAIIFAVLCFRYRAELWARRPRTIGLWLLTGLGAGLAFLFLAIVFMATMSRNETRFGGLAMSAKLAQNVAYDGAELEARGSGGVSAMPGGAPSQLKGDEFQGLPSRIRLPSVGRTYSFSQAMIDRNGKPSVSATLVSTSLITAGLYISVLVLLTGVFSWRQRWKAVLRLE